MRSSRLTDLRAEWGLTGEARELTPVASTITWRYCPQHGRPFRATPDAPYCPFGPPPGCPPEWTRPAREQEIPAPVEWLRSCRVISPEAQAPLGRRATKEPKRSEPISPYVWRAPESDAIKRAPDRPRLLGERERDARGRFVAEPRELHQPDDPAVLSDAQIRAGLRKLWYASPKGCKARLARLCGYRGSHARRTLRGVVRGTAQLLDAQRRHISVVLRAINREELVLVKTDLLHSDGRHVHLWRWMGQPKDAHRVPLPSYRRPGRPRKTGDAGTEAKYQLENVEQFA